ncbi:hypothetical protein SAMN04487960_1181, partial [Marinobacter mobilis]
SIIDQSRPPMSGNGGNPHSLRDLLGTYEKSGLEISFLSPMPG